MKKSRFFIGVLSLSLTVLMSIAFATSSSASLFCSDLRNCSGQAGCSGAGSVSGCTITCTDGSSVTCNSNGGGEEEILQ
jgi:hypothetical protein